MDIEIIKKSKTKYLGKEIEYYKEIDSTHLYSKTVANNEQKSGKIIIAENQTAGIGTKGKTWHTGENKNIAMTIIIKPKCKIEELLSLTIDIAKAMQKTIKELYSINLQIKEPNDLILNEKKICGILTEISTSGEKINYLLISLGFNVNEDDFAKEIVDIATSLKCECGKEFSREEIISKFLENLEEKIISFL